MHVEPQAGEHDGVRGHGRRLEVERPEAHGVDELRLRLLPQRVGALRLVRVRVRVRVRVTSLWSRGASYSLRANSAESNASCEPYMRWYSANAKPSAATSLVRVRVRVRVRVWSPNP